MDAKASKQNVWFYPKYDGIKAFYGTKDIILLGLNPSSGKFPSKRDKYFYSLLKEKEFDNIHLTDLIKIRAKNKDVTALLSDKVLIKKQIDFFLNELLIIRPKIIITIGNQCYNLLKQYIPDISLKSKIFKIKHYSFRYQKIEDVFSEISEDFNKIIEEYKALK